MKLRVWARGSVMQLVAEMSQRLGVGKSLCFLASLRLGSERFLMG